ncbi:MAG: glycosyltransferase family 39 protein [Isosphaeraceae bacterium]
MRNEALNFSTPAGDAVAGRFGWNRTWIVILLSILTVATVLRAWNLDQLSFWYDEVVTMRLAEAASPGELLARLSEIDATRAPLHPLVLQAWVRVFGSSEAAARALSVACGVATVALVYAIGRMAFDISTGLFSSALAAISPPLVLYSREARMYAWLVMVTCLCWALLFALHRDYSQRRAIAYALGMIALVYSHPLGLLMFVALSLGSLVFAREFFGHPQRWLAVHLAVFVATAPWISHYFDHAPEFLSGRLPLRFLLGTPIGFLGGNFVVLAGLVCLAGFGLARRRLSFSSASDWAVPGCLLLWLVLPPSLLYAYSWLGSPVFGPERYTLFVAPAFLILVAQGLPLIRPLFRYGVLIGLGLLASSVLPTRVYKPDLKADWRGCSATIAAAMAANPDTHFTVVVKSTYPTRNVEVETARYYLPPQCQVLAFDALFSSGADAMPKGEVYLAISSNNSQAAPPVSEKASFTASWQLQQRYPGLLLYRK